MDRESELDAFKQINLSLIASAHGYEIDRKRIVLDTEVRTTGEYTATVSVHPEVDAKLKFVVEPKEAEAV